MRVTKRDLQIKLDQLNKDRGLEWELEHNTHYGYCLSMNSESVRVTERMTGRELYQFLSGALVIVWDRYTADTHPMRTQGQTT